MIGDPIDNIMANIMSGVRDGMKVPSAQIRPPMDDEEIARVAKIGPTLEQEREDEIPHCPLCAKLLPELAEVRDHLFILSSETMTTESRASFDRCNAAIDAIDRARKLLLAEQMKEAGLLS